MQIFGDAGDAATRAAEIKGEISTIVSQKEAEAGELISQHLDAVLEAEAELPEGVPKAAAVTHCLNRTYISVLAVALSVCFVACPRHANPIIFTCAVHVIYGGHRTRPW